MHKKINEKMPQGLKLEPIFMHPNRGNRNIRKCFGGENSTSCLIENISTNYKLLLD